MGVLVSLGLALNGADPEVRGLWGELLISSMRCLGEKGLVGRRRDCLLTDALHNTNRWIGGLFCITLR